MTVRKPGRRSALLASAAMLSVAFIAPGWTAPASASLDNPAANDWGDVVAGKNCVQAHSWIARVQGIGGAVNTALFASHYPVTPDAPETRAGGQDLINLAPTGVGLGVGKALYTKALGNKLPASPGQPDLVPALCHAYAEAGGASVDVGIPYLKPLPACQFIPKGVPGADCTQMSPLGVHVEAIEVNATATPGKPVALKGGAAAGYISVAGLRLIDIPKIWVTNGSVRIPPDLTVPPIAMAGTNEQVTTDGEGKPTVDATGHYAPDPKASSGYVNAIHASVLGSNVADATVGHAAVLSDSRYLPAPICKYTSARCAGTTR